jgi:hypothetical protein
MARLATSVLVGALIRQAEVQGGFAAVLAKGDAQAGSILVLLRRSGRKECILERLLQLDGGYLWQDAAPQLGNDEVEIGAFLDRRRKYDPDLWLVELDIPSPERFAAEMNRLN